MQDSPTVSLVIPITRYWALNQLFAPICGQSLRTPVREILLYVDVADPRLDDGLEFWTGELKKCFGSASVQIVKSGKPQPSEINIAKRRLRVVEMRQDTKRFVGDTDYVWSVEDDTVIPTDTLKKFLETARRHPDLGFVEGVEVGRWEKIVGAWRLDDINKPTKVVTLPYTNPVDTEYPMLEEIDGGGMYNYLTPTKDYKAADYRVEAECLGVDMLYGVDLARAGKKNFIDWSIICGHNDFGNILYPHLGKRCVQVLYQLKDGKWDLTIIGDKHAEA